MLCQRIYAPSDCVKGHLPGRLLLLSACAFLLLMVMLAMVGCTPLVRAPQIPQNPSPPADIPVFTFEPLEVLPASPVAGQAFNVSMQVANTGLVAGTYKAELTVNGNNLDNRALYLDPGKAGSVTFQANLPVPGQYMVKIGPQSKEIFIGFNRVPANIRIDSGNVDGCDSLAGSTGQPGNMIQMVEGNLLKLSAPANGMEINSIDVFGYIKSSDYDFNTDSIVGGVGTWTYGADIATIETANPKFSIIIYDARKTRLFSGDFSKDLFGYYPRWVSVPLPDVPVSGDFYIELVTHNQPKLTGTGWGNYDYWHRYVVHTWYYQLCIGYENSLDVQSAVSQSGNVVPDRYLTYNWLMRAGGYQLQK
jgi:hypothetical protein